MRLIACLLFGGLLSAAPDVFPLRDVRPGMRAVGKTVFAGTRVEEFQIEILGVLENVGPKQSLILGRLSGGPLAKTGVMAGMSGSPVYIDGRLAGALAMAFAFSTEPIAGIRPIEDMLAVAEPPPPAPQRTLARAWDGRIVGVLPPPEEYLSGGGRLVDIATPVSFGGFTRNTLEHFAPQLRALGLEPRQGVSGGAAPRTVGPPAPLESGSMISVQLLSGDWDIGADGTVTYIDGNRVYAFGHRFLSVGATELPFSLAEVITLLPNIATSFKISAAREWAGTITQDRSVAVTGEIGRRASMIPVSINLVRRGANNSVEKSSTYTVRMANDRVLSPFLLQMVVFSVIDATEQVIGEGTVNVSGQVEFEGTSAPLKLSNTYAGDFNIPGMVSLATASPVAYVMQSGFDTLRPKRVVLDIEALPRKRQFQIDELWASRREARPGDTIELTLALAGDNGAELIRKVSYTVPIGARPGPLQFTAADANTINLTEFRQMLVQAPRSAEQLVATLNAFRPNTRAYLRVWRAEPSYDVQGENLPDPPPSLAMILARTQPSLSAVPAMPNSRVAEYEIPAGGAVVTGSKTIQVDIKE